MLQKSRFLLTAGLFVTAGLFANGHPVLAQTRECPLSPAQSHGLEATEPPVVTAQEVTNGTKSLMDFTLAVRQRATVAHPYHFGCVIRQKGSPWRSGSTYIVVLTAEGTVLAHAKDMSLAGRQLKPWIYQDILTALKVGSGDIANLHAPLREAVSREGGSFKLKSPPDTSSKAYAAAVLSPGFTVPNVLVAGFDLDESHLIPLADQIDHANPSITAKGRGGPGQSGGIRHSGRGPFPRKVERQSGQFIKSEGRNA